MARKPRPAPPGIPAAPNLEGPDLESMIRVDHAGEYGAVRIYEGQLAVLKHRRGARNSVAAIRKMAAQEEHHLATFNRLVNEHHVRPTALVPFWHVAGFALGAGTALLGEKAAMACTEAVETVIDHHYASQLEVLEDGALKDIVRQFRDEEIEHRDEARARARDAKGAPAYGALSAAIKAGCRIAIEVAKRV
jgi:ubiquinone biosynthesis monooxygenase Coq7